MGALSGGLHGRLSHDSSRGPRFRSAQAIASVAVAATASEKEEEGMCVGCVCGRRHIPSLVEAAVWLHVSACPDHRVMASRLLWALYGAWRRAACGRG